MVPTHPKDADSPRHQNISNHDAWDLLSPNLTDARRERLLAAAGQRTKSVRLVVQDIHHPHNVSACLRSAEAFGISDVDVVTLKEKFNPSTVAKGVSDWLNVRRHHTIESCVQDLKAQGYALAAGFPDQNAKNLAKIPLDRPIAVIFGNEHGGVADTWLPHIDHKFTIPMVGLVESLNISVSAAITLYTLATRARAEQTPTRYHLTAEEQKELLNQWVCRTIPTWAQQIEVLRRKRD